MDFSQMFSDQEVLRNFQSTVVLVLAILLIRFLTIRSIGKLKVRSNEQVRNLKVQINNLATLLVVLGLVIIWAAKLQSFAISILALGAAIVLATKELISCLLGGFFRAVSGTFKVGDRIEVGGVRGEVIDHNFMSTEIMEIGPGRLTHNFTGRSICIPNSLFLVGPVTREAWHQNYRLHTFSVVQPLPIDILEHKRVLLEVSTKMVSGYRDKVRQYMADIQKKESIEAPSTDPKVTIAMQSKDSVEFIVRVPVERLKTARIEQAIIDAYLRAVKC